jgi:hypothetical protein
VRHFARFDARDGQARWVGKIIVCVEVPVFCAVVLLVQCGFGVACNSF